jgi:hypothetical protein
MCTFGPSSSTARSDASPLACSPFVSVVDMVNWCNLWAEAIVDSPRFFVWFACPRCRRSCGRRFRRSCGRRFACTYTVHNHGPRFRVEWSVRLCRELCGRRFACMHRQRFRVESFRRCRELCGRSFLSLNVEEVDGLEVRHGGRCFST